MPRTDDKYSQHSSFIWPVWLNGWAFVYELSGYGFESRCCQLNFIYTEREECSFNGWVLCSEGNTPKATGYWWESSPDPKWNDTLCREMQHHSIAHKLQTWQNRYKQETEKSALNLFQCNTIETSSEVFLVLCLHWCFRFSFNHLPLLLLVLFLL